MSMSIQLNVKLGLMVLLFSATLANADGGLIFLEKIFSLSKK